MPAAWSAKDERKYKHIRKSCLARDGRKTRQCTRMAAATVSRDRKQEGRTLEGHISSFPFLVEGLVVGGLLLLLRRA